MTTPILTEVLNPGQWIEWFCDGRWRGYMRRIEVNARETKIVIEQVYKLEMGRWEPRSSPMGIDSKFVIKVITAPTADLSNWYVY